MSSISVLVVPVFPGCHIPVKGLDETEEEYVQRIEPLIKANVETLKSIKSLIRKHR